MYHIFTIVWCTVELVNSEHLVSSKFLETESGELVGIRDLYFENTIIWVCKGRPYEATILETHSECIYIYTHLTTYKYILLNSLL